MRRGLQTDPTSILIGIWVHKRPNLATNRTRRKWVHHSLQQRWQKRRQETCRKSRLPMTSVQLMLLKIFMTGLQWLECTMRNDFMKKTQRKRPTRKLSVESRKCPSKPGMRRINNSSNRRLWRASSIAKEAPFTLQQALSRKRHSSEFANRRNSNRTLLKCCKLLSWMSQSKALPNNHKRYGMPSQKAKNKCNQSYSRRNRLTIHRHPS